MPTSLLFILRLDLYHYTRHIIALWLIPGKRLHRADEGFIYVADRSRIQKFAP